MSHESAARFRSAINADEALRREFEATVRTEGQLVSFAIAHGFDVSPADLRADIAGLTELDEAELSGVAGGLGGLVACDGSSKQPVLVACDGSSKQPVLGSPDLLSAFNRTLGR